MNWLALLIDWMLPVATTLAVAAVILLILRRVIPDEPSTRVIRQLVTVGVVLFANVALVLAMPLDSATTGQLLSLFGLVVTAVIALSSTTFVSNAMAGLMLRAVGGFIPGTSYEWEKISVGLPRKDCCIPKFRAKTATSSRCRTCL